MSESFVHWARDKISGDEMDNITTAIHEDELNQLVKNFVSEHVAELEVKKDELEVKNRKLIEQMALLLFLRRWDKNNQKKIKDEFEKRINEIKDKFEKRIDDKNKHIDNINKVIDKQDDLLRFIETTITPDKFNKISKKYFDRKTNTDHEENTDDENTDDDERKGYEAHRQILVVSHNSINNEVLTTFFDPDTDVSFSRNDGFYIAGMDGILKQKFDKDISRYCVGYIVTNDNNKISVGDPPTINKNLVFQNIGNIKMILFVRKHFPKNPKQDKSTLENLYNEHNTYKKHTVDNNHINQLTEQEQIELAKLMSMELNEKNVFLNYLERFINSVVIETGLKKPSIKTLETYLLFVADLANNNRLIDFDGEIKPIREFADDIIWDKLWNVKSNYANSLWKKVENRWNINLN